MGGAFTTFSAVDWFDSRDDLAVILVRALLLVLPILILVPGLIWWERRLLSWMQDRIGPNRVATVTIAKDAKWAPSFLRGRKIKLFGLLQPIADGIKLFFKEDVTPASVDKVVYMLAPAIALFPAFALGGTMPWGPQTGIYGLLTPVADVNIGVLYVMAVSSMGVYGIVLGGYASNNKYSLLGGLRSSAQLISYELAMGVSLACIVLASGSLRMTDMVRVQEGALIQNASFFNYVQGWFVFTPFGFLAAIIFLICMIAETNRAPFDLPEAENELIAGYHTEYSSMKFAVYFMGEYAAMFIYSGIFAAVFMGGYNLLPIRWEALIADYPGMSGFFGVMHQLNYTLAPMWFFGKIAFFISFYIWLRATLPRLRYDQLMSLGWKTMLPLAAFNFVAVAVWIVVRDQFANPWISVAAAFGMVLLLVALYAAFSKKARRKAFVPRTVRLVDPNAQGASS